jgi:biotin synthase
MPFTDAELTDWLRTRDPGRVAQLFAAADRVRREHVGDAVHLRGLVEISNHCVRACGYCGISVHNREVRRYRMPMAEVVACARRAVELGYGTVVLQAGEDPGLDREWVSDCIRLIKDAGPELAVTLSLGEQEEDDLAAWRAAGADRYLLRFEASNPDLFARIHPPRRGQEPRCRIAQLRMMRRLGYAIGSGVMVGIPGQTWADLVRDLRTFQDLDLEMIGIGPWIPHPSTPLASDLEGAADPLEQVPNDKATALAMVAMSRILVPDANLPATTAVATIDQRHGREDALCAGANVVMPNLTPPAFRALYEIYPDKACVNETAEQCHPCLSGRIAKIGRTVGTGRGDAPRKAMANLTK